MKHENRDYGFEIRPYDFPDCALLTFDNTLARAIVWQPEFSCVVIGRGSNVDQEINIENIAADNLPVYQRPSGGCAVILTPEMLVVSFGLRAERQLSSKDYFRRFNELIIRALERQGVTSLSYRGTSDIALDEQKIAGTALYRNRERIFFHAVINLADNTELMERYLKLPPRMPDYRAGRSHHDFVTSLRAARFDVNLPAFSKDIESEFLTRIESAAA